MNRYSWRPWFAWYPVKWYVPVNEGNGWSRTYNGRLWMRWIECRHVGAVAPNGDLTDYWEYRLR